MTPTSYKVDGIRMDKQVCIIPFHRDFLLVYIKLKLKLKLKLTPLGIAGSVDMFRILEHAMKAQMAPVIHDTQAVDTPEYLVKIEKSMKVLNV